MTDQHGSFPQLDLPATTASSADAAPQGPEPVEPEAEAVGADGFDRARVLRLLDRLERDVAAVETAMVHVEAGEHEAYAAAVATLETHVAD